ncbi:MAG: sigma-70 family RNA polymerase sigma factor [Planctomycetes bacterium]|nr:sigma-70 family RNA polymerase sigma factor [Planctomycetota bacterium]
MADWPSIVEMHAGGVWRTAYRLVGNDADAADCVQEAFVAALAVSRRQSVENWPALLGRLVTCRALDLLRRRVRHRRRHEELACWDGVACPSAGPERHAEAAELSARLRDALGKLPSRQAEIFCLRFLNELSYEDIARQLGMKPSAVGVALHRARRRLRGLLTPHEVDVVDVQPEVSP